METLRIFCITWNVETTWPQVDLHSLLGLNSKTKINLPDIYFISLQEVRSQPHDVVMDMMFEEPWTTAFREILGPHNYVRLTGERLQGMVTSIFVLRKHLPYFRDIYTAVTRTGLAGFWGNKGGISVRFSLYGCSVCVVNSHLAAHDSGYEDRCRNYNTIIDDTIFPVQPTSNILFHDYVFWLGDLNYRLSGEETASAIATKICEGELDWLLTKDELKKAQKCGDAFEPFTEGEITFKPTYKYTSWDQYDLNRRPAWTDRILYQVHEAAYENTCLGLEQLTYEAKRTYSQSDHKPVVSSFEIKVFAHHLERCVSFTCVDEWMIGAVNHVSYSLDGTVSTSPWDYIALFKANFTSVHQYVTYAYVSLATALTSSSEPLVSEEGESASKPLQSNRSFKLAMSDELVQSPGSYVFVYYSAKYSCYLGMSDPFPVVERP